MPVNSIQVYVKNLLDGLPIPNSTQTLEAYITPPTVEDIDNPKAYVMAARARGGRQTAPRVNMFATGPGYKKVDYTVEIYLTYETLPDSPTVDNEFPIIIDTVLNKLWTTQMPIFIDPNGTPYAVTPPTLPSGSSQVLMVGEEWDLEYPPERVPATLRLLYYTARISLALYEAVNL